MPLETSRRGDQISKPGRGHQRRLPPRPQAPTNSFANNSGQPKPFAKNATTRKQQPTGNNSSPPKHNVVDMEDLQRLLHLPSKVPSQFSSRNPKKTERRVDTRTLKQDSNIPCQVEDYQISDNRHRRHRDSHGLTVDDVAARPSQTQANSTSAQESITDQRDILGQYTSLPSVQLPQIPAAVQNVQKQETVAAGIFWPFGTPGGGAPPRHLPNSKDLPANSYQQRHAASRHPDQVHEQTGNLLSARQERRHNLYPEEKTISSYMNKAEDNFRTVPAALRSSITFGVSSVNSIDEVTEKEAKRLQWLAELAKQVEEKRRHKGMAMTSTLTSRRQPVQLMSPQQSFQLSSVLRHEQALSYQGVPSETSRQQTTGYPGHYAAVTDESTNGRSYTYAANPSLHGQNTGASQQQASITEAIIGSQPSAEHRRRKEKYKEHLRAVEEQIAEKKRLQEAERERKEREAAAEEKRVAEEQARLRQQFEEEKEKARLKEERARKRAEALQASLQTAEESAKRVRKAKLHGHHEKSPRSPKLQASQALSNNAERVTSTTAAPSVQPQESPQSHQSSVVKAKKPRPSRLPVLKQSFRQHRRSHSYRTQLDDRPQEDFVQRQRIPHESTRDLHSKAKETIHSRTQSHSPQKPLEHSPDRVVRTKKSNTHVRQKATVSEQQQQARKHLSPLPADYEPRCQRVTESLSSVELAYNLDNNQSSSRTISQSSVWLPVAEDDTTLRKSTLSPHREAAHKRTRRVDLPLISLPPEKLPSFNPLPGTADQLSFVRQDDLSQPLTINTSDQADTYNEIHSHGNDRLAVLRQLQNLKLGFIQRQQQLTTDMQTISPRA